MNIKRKINQCFVLLAAAAVLLPVLKMNHQHDQVSVLEKRKLAELSPIYKGVSVFMESVNDYVNDRIGFRDGMVKLYNEITVNAFKARHPQVIFGEDGWLFYQEELADYTGQNNTPERVERYVQILKAMDKWCADRGSQFVFMVGPNKSSVYHAYMPNYIVRAEETLLDALTARLQEEGIVTINPKAALMADAGTKELYCKLDTHWNAHGARYAMEELLEKTGLPKREFAVEEYRENAGDLLDMLAVESVGSDSLLADAQPNAACMIESVPDSKDVILHTPDAVSFVSFRDSFTLALTNYYSFYFDGPMYRHWDFKQLDEEEREFPQYIIMQCVERNIGNAVEANAGLLDTL